MVVQKKEEGCVRRRLCTKSFWKEPKNQDAEAGRTLDETAVRPKGGEGDPRDQPRTAKEGPPPVQRKQRKTTRKYVFSGKFAGQNGGKRRVFRNQALNRVMENAPSAFVDAEGKSVMPKRLAYQGKYQEWWSRVHGKSQEKKIRATGKEIRATGKKIRNV